MNASSSYILSIAGLDPSSGAGLTSDIKTFQAHGLYGLSVCTALTVQNDISFEKVQWMPIDLISEQLNILFKRFTIQIVKIGITQNWLILNQIINVLYAHNSSIEIILDPVLRASSGFVFHENYQLLYPVLEKILLLTPNYQELAEFYPKNNIDQTINKLQSLTNIYLKGGHRADYLGLDQLYLKSGDMILIPAGSEPVFPKHGSGCVLSSAIASNICLGYTLKEACSKAKIYTENYLRSSKSLLGQHYL